MQNIRAFGMNLDVSNSDFQTIVHAVAVNEHHGQFHGRSIFNNQAQANEYNNKV